MTKQITVVISTWQVPFDQVVEGIFHFSTTQAALNFINGRAEKWWVVHNPNEQFPPCEELGYGGTTWNSESGEAGFQAMLDKEDYAELHEAYYKREFDDKGLTRPRYLINAYIAGAKPGGMSTDEAAQYATQQAEGFADYPGQPPEFNETAVTPTKVTAIDFLGVPPAGFSLVEDYYRMYREKYGEDCTLKGVNVWNMTVNIQSREDALLLLMNSAMHPPQPVFAYIVTLKRPNGTLVQEEIDGVSDEHATEEAQHLWAAELEDEGWVLVGVKRGETRNYCA